MLELYLQSRHTDWPSSRTASDYWGPHSSRLLWLGAVPRAGSCLPRGGGLTHTPGNSDLPGSGTEGMQVCRGGCPLYRRWSSHLNCLMTGGLNTYQITPIARKGSLKKSDFSCLRLHNVSGSRILETWVLVTADKISGPNIFSGWARGMRSWEPIVEQDRGGMWGPQSGGPPSQLSSS